MRISDALELTQQGSPAAPVSTRTLLYVKSDNRVYTKRGDGTETDVGSWGNLTGKPSTFPPDVHSHSEYSLTSHGHTGYATDTHTHSGYASATHGHTGYAADTHGHTGYAAVFHAGTHNTTTGSDPLDPASIGAAYSNHNHDTAYATLGHGHTGYASSTHNHDAAYATAGHSHSQYATTTDSGDINAVSPFSGSARFIKMGTVVFVFATISRASGFSGTFTDVCTVPAAYRPAVIASFAAAPFYNQTVTYRFRVDPTAGTLQVQMSAANATNMTVSAVYFL